MEISLKLYFQLLLQLRNKRSVLYAGDMIDKGAFRCQLGCMDGVVLQTLQTQTCSFHLQLILKAKHQEVESRRSNVCNRLLRLHSFQTFLQPRLLLNVFPSVLPETKSQWCFSISLAFNRAAGAAGGILFVLKLRCSFLSVFCCLLERFS